MTGSSVVQPPPIHGLRSSTSGRCPANTMYAASVRPLCPAPMTMPSNVPVVICGGFSHHRAQGPSFCETPATEPRGKGKILRGSGRCERLLLPLFWLCAPAKVGAHGRLRVAVESCYDAPDGASVIGWRSLHTLRCTSTAFRRQAAPRHDVRGWRRTPEPA